MCRMLIYKYDLRFCLLRVGGGGGGGWRGGDAGAGTPDSKGRNGGGGGSFVLKREAIDRATVYSGLQHPAYLKYYRNNKNKVSIDNIQIIINKQCVCSINQNGSLVLNWRAL